MLVRFVDNEFMAKLKVFVVQDQYRADQIVCTTDNSLEGIPVYKVSSEYMADMKVFIDNSTLNRLSHTGYSGGGYGGGSGSPQTAFGALIEMLMLLVTFAVLGFMWMLILSCTCMVILAIIGDDGVPAWSIPICIVIIVIDAYLLRRFYKAR